MTQKKENLIIQLKEEEMKNRSRSLFQRTANSFEEKNNSFIKSKSLLNKSIKIYTPGEQLKQSSKKKIKLLSSQPIISSERKTNNIDMSLKNLEYNYDNLVSLSLLGLNHLQNSNTKK